MRVELGISCPKGAIVDHVAEAFKQLSRGEQAEIVDGWLLQVPRTVFDQVLQDMKKTEAKALKDRKLSKASGNKKKKLAGFPTFRKWQYAGSVRLQVNARKNKEFREHWQAGKLFIPGLGVLKFRDQNFVLPLAPPSMITLARDAAGSWHVSFICIEKEYHQIKPKQATLLTTPLPLDPETGFPVASSIDLSLTHLGVNDQGETLGRTKYLKRYQGKLRFLNKALARKKKGSGRWHKTKQQLGALHVKIANCRDADLRHKAKAVVDNAAIVCLEDYSQHFILQNPKLAQSGHDAAFGIFKTFIAQECHKQGKLLLKCGRFDASTQVCSSCDFKNTQLKNNLNIRTWVCPKCETHHDRDHNAAINILIMALTRAIEQFSSPGTSTCLEELMKIGPENGLGMSKSHLAQHSLHPELSAFIARGGLTACLEHYRSKLCHKANSRLGLQEACEARVDPVQHATSCRERGVAC